jgi:hypothetical protein
MATVSVKSTQITNRDASPRVRSNSRISRGALLCSMGVCATTAADDIGSKYNLCSIPSNARVAQLLLSCSSLGTAGAANIGLWQTTDNGGAVVDADFFASAVVLTSALSNSDITTEANGANASIGKEDMEKPIWEILGLTADPKIDYDIVAQLTAATVDAGYVALQAVYQL